MTPVVLSGVSGASLGDLLKGYGAIAVIGAEYPDALFWWDADVHLVVGGCPELTNEQVTTEVRERLPKWAAAVGEGLQKGRANKKKGIAGGSSPLESAERHDRLTDDLAEVAAGVAVFVPGARPRKHPLFPSFGQDGSANYFKTLQSEAGKLTKSKKTSKDLEAALFGRDAAITRALGGTGGLFFSNAIKRYATGSSWIHEKDAPLSGWDFLLAIRGASLLRGALRAFRGSRRSYSAFPFVFRGSPIKASGKIFVVEEIFLPTWPAERPRTLAEFQIQIRQFQARVGGGEMASSAAEFRRAVQGKGVAGGFDRFHRFVLERRKPRQRQPAVQAISRGVTAVGEGATDLRTLLVRVDESGWLDQLEQSQVPPKRRDEELLLAARNVHDAIHACADEPSPVRHLDLLRALWHGNHLLLTRGASAWTRPIPPLPSSRWERILAPVFEQSAEARIARALASVGWDIAWPITTQILPIEYVSALRIWRIPDPAPGHRVQWNGNQPEREFAQVFWRRWLDAAHLKERGSLPYGATRFARLADVLKLLRGELDSREIHRYCSALLLLDWSPKASVGTESPTLPISIPYAILRLWLETGIHPPNGSRMSWDGSVPQCLLRGDPNAIRTACRIAISRLRVTGLPALERDRRAGRSVASVLPVCSTGEAHRMSIAVLVPVASLDTDRLAKRLWVTTREEQQEKETAYA